jgi:hypothetical protein
LDDLDEIFGEGFRILEASRRAIGWTYVIMYSLEDQGKRNLLSAQQ